MVAGWGVGHITHPFESGIKPNGRQLTRRELPAPLPIESSQWIATFELGSTAILITEPNDLVPAVQADQKLNYGQSLFVPSSPEVTE